MTKIQFCNLKAKNVLSIGEEVSIDYNTGKGLTYVYGDNKDTGGKNGSGKSSILVLCLLIALFGKTINNTNNAYLYNRIASYKEGGYIELTFIKNSSEHYRIFVEIKTNKKKDWCALNYHLFKDEEDITKASKLETLRYIEEDILGCNFEIFKNAIVMSSSNLMNFFEMPKRIKNEYLHGIFSLNNFGKSYDIVNSKFNELKKSIKSLSNNLITISSKLEELEGESDRWSETHSSDITNITKKLSSEKSKYLSKKDEIVEEPEDYDTKLELIEKAKQIKTVKVKAEKKLKDIKNSIAKLNSTIKFNELLLEKNSDLISCLCDDCKPKVSKLFELDKAEQIIKESTDSIQELIEQEQDVSAKIDKLEKFIEKSQSAVVEINDYQNANKMIKQSIKHLKENIISLKEQLDNTLAKTNPYEKILKDSIDEKKSVSESLDKMTTTSQYYGLLKEVFSDNGVKQIIIQNIIEVLNQTIQTYLKQMGADFFVYFDNKLVYNFFTPSGPCEYSSFSAGERRKLDLAILFSFRDVLSCSSLKTNICIVDEILDSAIDSLTLDSVISILKNKSKMDNQSIYVISHREGLVDSDIFDHRLRVEKENGESKLYQEF